MAKEILEGRLLESYKRRVKSHLQNIDLLRECTQQYKWLTEQNSKVENGKDLADAGHKFAEDIQDIPN